MIRPEAGTDKSGLFIKLQSIIVCFVISMTHEVAVAEHAGRLLLTSLAYVADLLMNELLRPLFVSYFAH